MASAAGSDLKDYECAICKEYFDTPCSLKCDHIFCLECIIKHFDKNRGQNMQKCPVCQTMVNVYLKKPADFVLERMKQTWTQCPGCRTKVSLADYKKHQSRCDAEPVYFNPSEEETRDFGMNRFTFTCPYCTEMHLDREALLQHCKTLHAADTNQKRVCPICAAMPWGMSDLKSSNLLQHMKLRHRFDYDYFVDFGISEEEQLRIAMANSNSSQLAATSHHAQ